MRKQRTRFFQKGLCGILSAAMILTSSMIPDMSVFAAQPDVEDTGDSIDVGQDEMLPGENEGVVQNPEAGDGDTAGSVNDDKNGDSGQEDGKAPEQPGGGYFRRGR